MFPKHFHTTVSRNRTKEYFTYEDRVGCIQGLNVTLSMQDLGVLTSSVRTFDVGDWGADSRTDTDVGSCRSILATRIPGSDRRSCSPSYGKCQTPCKVPPPSRRLAGEPQTAVFRPLPNTPSKASFPPLLRKESVTYVSGTMCYLCLRPLIRRLLSVVPQIPTFPIHPTSDPKFQREATPCHKNQQKNRTLSARN